MTEIQWKKPPRPTNKYWNRKAEWEDLIPDIIEQVKQKPGTWALVYVGPHAYEIYNAIYEGKNALCAFDLEINYPEENKDELYIKYPRFLPRIFRKLMGY